MSMPTISDINPEINIVRDDAVNILMASIAMEELALAHILNAEGEKLQYVLGTLAGRDPGEVTICDIMAVNNSVHKTLRDVIKEEMLLQLKLEDAIALAESASECQLTIRGQKIWRDGNNVASTRPATVEINLLRDGEVFKTVTVDSTGDGAYTFACLPLWRDSENRYTYQVNETVVPTGYDSTVSGYNVTNTVQPGSITIGGSKIWDDFDNASGDRPANTTVILLRNGVRIDTRIIDNLTATDNVVPFSFDDVPQFDDQGVPYVYTVDEETVAGYRKTINAFAITNAIEIVTVAGTKIWVDDDNVGNTRPDDITVILLRNGEPSGVQTTLDTSVPDNTVPFSFDDVPRFDAQGVPYVYTVDEEAVANYDKNIGQDNSITNTLTP